MNLSLTKASAYMGQQLRDFGLDPNQWRLEGQMRGDASFKFQHVSEPELRLKAWLLPGGWLELEMMEV